MILLRYIPISNMNFKDINPLDCGEEKCNPGFRRGPIIFDYYLLHYVFSGSGVFHIDGTDYVTSKGQISIIHPNKVNVYYTDDNNPWHYSWIGFETSLNIHVIKNNHLITLPQAEHIFSDLKNADKVQKGREYYTCAKIYELITLLEHLDSTVDATYDYVAKAKNYMDINYPLSVSFESLASSLGLSRNYLGKIFKEYEKITLYQYLTNVRLVKAIELMSMHHSSVSDAACRVGYPDIYTFSKAFKRKFGCSPSSYINKLT
ncbi:MAG: DNA-binding protein AraC-type [Oscillospiraceae bacterium]|nr:DNA-binding protein AraC-type [Oscillospiraceae bacterium]